MCLDDDVWTVSPEMGRSSRFVVLLRAPSADPCLQALRLGISTFIFKDKVEFWSHDCIVTETLWNRSEKIDHLAYEYWCVLKGAGIIKMIRNLAQSW